MNLSIGTTILQLRKKCNLTQEQFANSIGISAQAVSKWETGSSYPDINLLPVIADFFKVSTDYLLGYNFIESTKDITEILLEIRQLILNEEYQSALGVIENIQAYPINYEVEFEKGIAKRGIALKEDNDKSREIYFCEARSIFEMVIKNCNNMRLIIESKKALAVIYNHLKKYDKAIEIVNSIDGDADIAGIISFSYMKKGDYNACIKILQEHLLSSIEGIHKCCFSLCTVQNKIKDFDKSLKYNELWSEILDVVRKHGKTNLWNSNLGTAYFYKISSMIKSGRHDEVMEVLVRYVDYVINMDKQKHDEINSVWYFNLLDPCKLKRTFYESEILLSNLKYAGMYKKLREKSGFEELIDKLEKEVLLLKENVNEI